MICSFIFLHFQTSSLALSRQGIATLRVAETKKIGPTRLQVARNAFVLHHVNFFGGILCVIQLPGKCARGTSQRPGVIVQCRFPAVLLLEWYSFPASWQARARCNSGCKHRHSHGMLVIAWLLLTLQSKNFDLVPAMSRKFRGPSSTPRFRHTFLWP